MGADFPLRFGLLEGVVNRHWKRWVRLLCKVVNGTGHAVEEEVFGIRLATMAKWICY